MTAPFGLNRFAGVEARTKPGGLRPGVTKTQEKLAITARMIISRNRFAPGSARPVAASLNDTSASGKNKRISLRNFGGGSRDTDGESVRPQSELTPRNRRCFACLYTRRQSAHPRHLLREIWGEKDVYKRLPARLHAYAGKLGASCEPDCHQRKPGVVFGWLRMLVRAVCGSAQSCRKVEDRGYGEACRTRIFE